MNVLWCISPAAFFVAATATSLPTSVETLRPSFISSPHIHHSFFRDNTRVAFPGIIEGFAYLVDDWHPKLAFSSRLTQ